MRERSSSEQFSLWHSEMKFSLEKMTLCHLQNLEVFRTGGLGVTEDNGFITLIRQCLSSL